MANSKAKTRGMMYNLKSTLDGLIKLLENDIISPDQAVNGLTYVAKQELGKLKDETPDEAPE